VLDNHHFVAWDDEIGYATRWVEDLKSALPSGEGLVFELTGPGTAWYQTRDRDSVAGTLAPRMPNGR
jgi:uncharacterized protein (AIM24 family)